MNSQKNFDSQLQTYFGAIKRSIKEEHVSYLKSHPELRQILNDFLSSCLLQQPDNIYDYASKYFAYFNYQKDNLRYKPLIISGASGAGKGTIINYLLEKYPNIFELSISYTTRRPRPGQVHGRQYFFVTKEQFQHEIEKDVFAQYCEVHGSFYGTHKGKLNDIINRGKIGLVDIDIQGGQKIHRNFSDCNFIFIDVPNIQILEQRLKNRGDDNQQTIQRRMNNAKEEIEISKGLNYYNRFTNANIQEFQKQIQNFIKENYKVDF